MVPSLYSLLVNRRVKIPGRDMEGKVVLPGALWVCCQGTQGKEHPSHQWRSQASSGGGGLEALGRCRGRRAGGRSISQRPWHTSFLRLKHLCEDERC